MNLTASRLLVCFFATSVLLLGIACESSFAEERKLTVWKLVQLGNILGRRVCYISDLGFKQVFEKDNYTMIYAAPDWRLHYFNTERKTIFTTTPEGFFNRSSFRTNLIKQNFLPINPVVIKGLSRVEKGHKIQSYIVKSSNSGHSTKLTGANFAVEAHWDVCEEIVMTPEISRMTDFQMGQPVQSRNFPYRINVILEDGSKKNRLSTVVMEKMTVPADFFQAPKGFRLVKDESEITVGDGLINDLINDLGADLGKRK